MEKKNNKKLAKKSYTVEKFNGHEVKVGNLIKISKSAKIRKELIEAISTGVFCDLSDVGNAIGIVIGKYTNPKTNKDTWTYDNKDFIWGIEHGISISDGSHD